ncbi:MAG TPA: VOC family protein [Planctomycetota bacterium]|jgi:predicted 3-demethylubiquinone-9 3-methyltransferase (glyoxalase superfamily)|nr:VOC family protein [Planctomycetota bacterium]
MSRKQKIATCLWFDDNAEEAMNFYVSTFKNSKILKLVRYGEGGPGPKGTVMVGTFQLEGQEFMALNGGPQFKFTEAVSLLVTCETQEELDDLWKRLTAGGGAPSQCGWLKDRFGLSWQIVPSALLEMVEGKDGEMPKRAMDAILGMTKIDIEALRRSYAGR